MSITCGNDWAEGHHDISLVDHDGREVARARIETGVAGFTALLNLIAQHGGTAEDTPVAIEKNLLVVALSGAGFTVYPINPRAVARYRERHGQAGAKSDPGDARVLADILRTDQDRHRRLPAVTEHGLAVKALARQHQEAIWALHQTPSRLRSVLLEFYPQALQAFPKLTHKTALTIIAAASTPELVAKLTPRRVVALLRRCGRRNDPTLVHQILTDLKTPALRQPAAVEAALGTAVVGRSRSSPPCTPRWRSLKQRSPRNFDTHPLSAVLRSAPGLGPVLAARVLAEVGDDLARFDTAAGLRAFAGTAPVTRASGRSKYVKARNRRLGDACHWWAFAALTKSPGARQHYHRRRAAGDHHNAALRNLSNKLIGRIWWCLQHNEPWDEQVAWPPAHTIEPPAA